MLGGGERKHRQPSGPSAHARGPAQAPASRAGRPRRTSLAGIVYGGLTGLLLVAAFWIVLGLQEPAGSRAPSLVPDADAQGVQAPQCTSLALDRHQGRTTAEPCPGQALPFREASAAAAGDRAAP
jgi:hypothetical protein